MAWLAWAIPAAISLGSAIYGANKDDEGGETVTADEMQTPQQKEVGNQLSGFIQNYLKNFVPGQGYNGKFTAGATGLENLGLDQLGSVMNNPATGDLFAAGKNQILDTLGGKFADPNESPYIKSMINLSKQNLGDLVNQTRARRGARGTYYTKAGLNEESQLNERTVNSLNSVIGDFMNTERNRQFQAAPMAQSMDQYSTLTAPLTKIQASQSLGGLQRTIEQSDLEAQYNAYLNQRREMALPLQTAQGFYSSNVPYGLKALTMPGVNQGSDTTASILNLLTSLNLGSLLGGSKTGGGGVTGGAYKDVSW